MELLDQIFVQLKSVLLAFAGRFLPPALLVLLSILISITAIALFAPVTMMYLTWLERKIVGFEVRDRAPARDGYPVLVEGQPVSRVTSGSFAPFLKKNIGLAYLPMEFTAPGTNLQIQVRDHAVDVQVVETPFYKRKK